MKNLYIKSFAAIFGMSVLAGCGENSWNDHLDGFEEPPIYSKTEAITYQLTQEDYGVISGLAANKALATTEEEMNALKAIANNKCFATQEEARKYLPAFFQCDDFPYFTLIDGSSIKVTYAVAEEAPGEVDYFKKGITEYSVTENDYMAAWESDEDFINAFAPMNPASSKLPRILKAAYPDAEEGMCVAVNYNEATTNPIFGSVSGSEWEMTDVIKNVSVDDELNIRGIVTGISTRGFVVSDNAGSICYDSGANGFSDENIAIGAQVNVKGTVSVYNRCLQIGKDNSYEVVGMDEYNYPKPVVYDGAMVDAACAETSDMLAQYVELTGTLSISGNYYNINIEGAEKQGSVYYAPDYIKEMLADGETYKLTGYFVAVTGKGNYFNLLITGVNGNAKSAPMHAPVGMVETVSKNAVYIFNGNKWSTAPDAIAVQPEDYAEMGMKYGNFQDDQPDTYLPLFLKKKLPYASEGDKIIVVYKYYSGKANFTWRRYILSGGEWIVYNNTESISEQFNKLKGEWKFDPSVTLTLPSGKGQALSTTYYQACVDWVFENIDKPLGSTSIKSGIGYVTTYGNNEYYSGTSAYQNNVDLRAASARTQYPKGYEGMSDEEIVALMKKRFEEEVMPGALSALHPDAVAIEGIDVLYTINFSAYDGTTAEYTGVWKVVGNAKFEFVSCTWNKE